MPGAWNNFSLLGVLSRVMNNLSSTAALPSPSINKQGTRAAKHEMASNSILNTSTDERRWVNQISEMLKEDPEGNELDIPASIFQVPKTLSAVKPEAYVPQLIALGPYHHLRPELYGMERHKIAAAKRANRHFKNLKFHDLVEKLMEFELNIRSCYHKYLDLDGDTLVWIMAIDGLFLLEFLRTFVNKDFIPSSSSGVDPPLADSVGRKLAKDAILRDVMMLENQIPIFLLREILTIQCPSSHIVADLLPSMLVRVCEAPSPIKLNEDYPLSDVLKHAHLLDLLYALIVPRKDPNKFASGSSSMRAGEDTVFVQLWDVASNQNASFVSQIKQPIDLILGKISKIPGISKLVANFSSNGKKETLKQTNVWSEKKAPLVEEIMIPSASYLHKAGVKFSPSGGDITNIRFDERTITFYLPVINLDCNSEVIMRNLVAYEASAMTESLVFTRYTEFMNWIIDTAEDVRLLREREIIINRLNSDDEVADLFNEMSKSIGLSEASDLDKTIEKVNKYYYGTWRVKAYKLTKTYVFASWKMLTLVATVLLLLLMGLQTFCSLYNCPRVFNTDQLKN